MVKAQPKKAAAAAAAVNRGAWTPEEDKKLVDYVRHHGHHNWRTLPEKADNEIKNYWNSHLSRRALSTDDLNHKLFINPNFSNQPLQVNETTTAAAPACPLPIRLVLRKKCPNHCAALAATMMAHENGVIVLASATLAAGWSGRISPMMQLSTPELIDTYKEFDGMAQLLDWADHIDRQTSAGDDVAIGAQEEDGGESSSSDGLGAWPSAWEFYDLDKVIDYEMGDEHAPKRIK